jgi:protein-disulfide isomerase
LETSSISVTTADASQLLLPIQAEDHVHGPDDAAYTLVEYGDYECPACGELFRVLRDLQGELQNELRIVFRHFPLSGIHPRAQEAAEAAEAAAAQDRFWEMHDHLFEDQHALSFHELVRSAEALSLDVKRFRTEIKERKYEDRVREDFRRGVANGVYGTPALFINGIRYDGSWERQMLLDRMKGG